MTAVALIDLAPARGGARRERETAARAIDAACREMGFFAITGHGVPDHPNYDTLIECVARPGEAKHPPVRSGAYRDLKYARIGLAGAGALAPGTA